jgi:hypothetical protein
MNYRETEKACEAQRAAARPEPEGYEHDEVVYLTAEDVINGISGNDEKLQLITDALNCDLAWQMFDAIASGKFADAGLVLKIAVEDEARFRADRINRCREEGLAEFRANKAEFLESER